MDFHLQPDDAKNHELPKQENFKTVNEINKDIKEDSNIHLNGNIHDEKKTIQTDKQEGLNGINKTIKNDDLDDIYDDDDEEWEDLDFNDSNRFTKFIGTIQTALSEFGENYGKLMKYIFLGTLLILFHVYLGFAIAYNLNQALALLVLTSIGWVLVLYFFFYKPLFSKTVNDFVLQPVSSCFDSAWGKPIFRWSSYVLLLALIVVYLIVDTKNSRYRLVSLSGLIFYFLLLFVFSKHPSRVNWRPVWWGLALQVILGFLVLRWQAGVQALRWFSDQIVTFLNYTNQGSSFVYGYLAVPPNICGMSAIFIFSSLQVILYFGAVVAILYYYGIMQFVIIRIAWLMQLTMGTTATESLNAAASVFLGMSEAPLLIKPYVKKLTTSELFAVLVSGLSCIAGSLFAAYASFGANPAYLVSASIMSAPASLSVAKLFWPETKKSKTVRVEDLVLPPGSDKNVIEAISNGATSVIGIVAQIGANLIVFLALLGFVDAVISWFGVNVGIQGLSLEKLLSYIFFPLAFLMGASDNPNWEEKISETMIVAELMGIKTILNEFIAYQKMSEYILSGQISGRPQMIATYALCGFSNISSIGIQLGMLGGLCPERKSVLSSIALRALIAGSITCFMTACIAGILVETPMDWSPTTSGASCVNITGLS